MQDGTVLGVVDALTAQHGIAQREDAGFVRELEQQRERFGGDAVLGVVEREPGGFHGEGVHPLLGVRCGKPIAHVGGADRLGMLRQGLPGGKGGGHTAGRRGKTNVQYNGAPRGCSMGRRLISAAR